MFYKSCFLLFTCFVSLVWLDGHKDGHCVMYDQCGRGRYGPLNCYYNGSAQQLNDEKAVTKLQQICPEFHEDKPYTCCTKSQVEKLWKDVRLPRRLGFGDCPSCVRNFQKNFCQLTCSPYQSRFLKVTKTTVNDDGKAMVKELEYFMSSKYAEELFTSCEHVEGIFPGKSLLKEMFCGKWEKDCTPQRWLDFMGSTPENSGFAPFQINYILHNESEVQINGHKFFPMNEKTTKCSEPSELQEEICQCKDCPDACSL